MGRQRKFTITLTGTIPKGMTLAQVRHAYWNNAFNGDSGRNYDIVSVDVDDYYDDVRYRSPRCHEGAGRPQARRLLGGLRRRDGARSPALGSRASGVR